MPDGCFAKVGRQVCENQEAGLWRQRDKNNDAGTSVRHHRKGSFLGQKRLPSLVIIEDAYLSDFSLLYVNYFLKLQIMPYIGS